MRTKVTVKGGAVLFTYPFGPSGPFEMMRTYTITTEDGRIEKIGEWNEPLMPDGEYEFPDELIDKIFNREVEIDDQEARICRA